VAPDSASAKTDVETGQPPPKSASGRTTISIHDTNHERTGFGRQAAPPDYKPVPLRWPFQVFLLVCIGGLMFFLEQVMRGLAGRIPPTLPSSPDELFDGDSPAPPARRALVTNRPASDRPSTSVAQLQARAQQITSTSAFPHSGEVTQYFGWEEPVVFQMCNDDGHLTVVTIVPPIYTSDPSWCPIFEDRSTNRGYTMDEPCEFIQDVLYRNETPLEGYDDLCRNQSGRPDHLVPQPWPLPVVVPEGIMMPLEISTSTDANGVPVTTTGYFHNVRTQTVITSTDCADGAVHTVTTSMPLPQTWRLLPGPRRVPNATSVSKYASAYMHGKFPYHEIALSFGDGQNLVTMLTWYDGRSSLPEHPLTSWGGFSPQSACPAGSTSLSTPTTATMETSQQSATSTPALVPIPVWIPPAPSTSMPPSTLSRSTMPSPSAISPTRKILIVSTSGLPSNESSARPSSGDTADSNENASNLGPSIGAGAATGDTISAATSPMPTPPPPPLPAVVVVVNGTTVTLPAPAAPTITTTVYEHGPLWSGPGTPEATYVTEGDFWLASVVPVLLSTLLSLVVGILSSSVKAMLPFRAMGRAEGAAAADSLCLRPNHFLWPLVSLRFLYRLRDPLPLLSDVLSLLATVLIPLSSEILRVEVYRNRLGIGLQRSTGPSRAAEALLAVMAAVIAALGLMLFRWRSGVPSYPWSMVAMASLLPARGETRRLLLSLPTPTDGTSIIPTSQVADLLSEHRFRLMYYRSDGSHHAEYGIGVTAPVDDTGSIRLTKRDRPKPREGKSRGGAGGGGLGAKLPQQLSLSSHMIESTLDAAFFLFLCSLLALLFYYENTSYDTSFERFLDSQKLGVRALFTTFGVAINLFWEYYLSRMYHVLCLFHLLRLPFFVSCLSRSRPRLSRTAIFVPQKDKSS